MRPPFLSPLVKKGGRGGVFVKNWLPLPSGEGWGEGPAIRGMMKLRN